ncbi:MULTISPECIES: hypothetical protein [unclassified Sphingomonas]|uniref:hypothetical protein n=1 Tax=unclassified Sphingomonas TaxID=196159 RepID=UPI001610E333|nr:MULTISPECIES: hypothetical protein [unclassified Sphingomonas]MBB3349311.1 hypothetical protein [Sphingomonas sp. BK069]MBB3475066.1 hypothetical protein [Sphingomonas sp. BK345]
MAMTAGLAAMLAACSPQTADYNRHEVPEDEARAQAAIERAAAQNGVATTARAGVPIAAPAETAARSRAFPTDFLGYWGISYDDCQLANTNATGRINVDADTIRLHEAKARVQRLEQRSPYEVVADLRFDGAGNSSWERRDRFTLEQGGTILVRTEAPNVQRYRRC